LDVRRKSDARRRSGVRKDEQKRKGRRQRKKRRSLMLPLLTVKLVWWKWMGKKM
jgi:hypothetical protein